MLKLYFTISKFEDHERLANRVQEKIQQRLRNLEEKAKVVRKLSVEKYDI